MSKAQDKIRGNFMTSTCGELKRICLCGEVEVTHSKTITLVIRGRDDDLYLEVNEELALHIISSLNLGLKQLKESK